MDTAGIAIIVIFGLLIVAAIFSNKKKKD